jgi:uncharacterized protein (DUF111 family)
VSRVALERAWRTVPLRGGDVRIKVGLRDGRILQASPEFDDVAGLARARGVPVREVLAEAVAAADAVALRPGEPWTRDGVAD